MSDTGDIFKSILRTTAGDVLKRLRDSDVTKTAAKIIGDLRSQRTRISAQELSTACADIRGVQSVTVGFVAGKLDIYVECDGGELAFMLAPESIRFAPRGAKEVIFTIQPEAAAARSVSADVTSVIAAEVAAKLWSFAPIRAGQGAAIADRRGNELCLDLRDTPAGRSLRGSAAELLLEAIELRSLDVEDDALVVQIGIPRPNR